LSSGEKRKKRRKFGELASPKDSQMKEFRAPEKGPPKNENTIQKGGECRKRLRSQTLRKKNGEDAKFKGVRPFPNSTLRWKRESGKVLGIWKEPEHCDIPEP